MRESILIGCHHGMKDTQIKYIHKTIKKFIDLKIK